MARKGFLGVFITICISITLSLSAQSNATYQKTGPASIFEALQSISEREGIITIHQSSEIRNRVGHVLTRNNQILGKEGNMYTVQGFRIQAYTGNTQESKSEAYSRAARIQNAFPEYNCYITFGAPFWRLQVGDFLTQQEAEEVKDLLKNALPGIAKEVYVVREKVRIRNYNPTTEMPNN
ncbi:hypothetical protein HQ47_00045 [Porphyromonas macacae]|uniref:Sporulation related domain n=1 Tax=Porphyromonas macacae TaxID=28115 RepID=A0A0A2EC75_9PORP|nr:SPOR domain-containing protein [Porphyromonas macacae]KGN76471.1 hypothetical protein HQ47_00045 [Porphyromonas macacae]SUB88849.1 Sporulation related domain [Porphyromonas macacae]